MLMKLTPGGIELEPSLTFVRHPKRGPITNYTELGVP